MKYKGNLKDYLSFLITFSVFFKNDISCYQSFKQNQKKLKTIQNLLTS